MKTKTKTKEQKAISKKAITHRLRDTLNKEITEEMTFAEILEKHPESANILFENGLMCIGCPMAIEETLEQGCKAHGMKSKEIEELIKKINKK